MINLTIPLFIVLTTLRKCSAARLYKMISYPMKVLLLLRDYQFDSMSSYWIRSLEMQLGTSTIAQLLRNALNDSCFLKLVQCT